MKTCLGMTLCALIPWTLACAPPEADVEAGNDVELDEDLQGGRNTRAYRAVGMLVTESGAVCTGSLIHPQVVLTAAHCAEEPIVAFYVGHGQALTDEERAENGMEHAVDDMQEHLVDSAVIHPDYRSSRCGDTPDLALVKLVAPADDVTPLKFTKPRATKPGRVCTGIGFGRHGHGESATTGRKRSGREQVLTVTDVSVSVKAKTGIADHGDSGGPLLCGRKISGVTSCGTDGSMRTRTVWYSRPDADWIAAIREAWGLP